MNLCRMPVRLYASALLFLLGIQTSIAAGLLGEYFNNRDLTGFVVSRTDAQINFDWGDGAPASGVDPDTFSVRWTGRVKPRFSQTYTFHATTDDGVRLWINGQLILDNWLDQPATTVASTPVALTANQDYDIQMEFYDALYGAVAKLSWSSPSQAMEIIPSSQLSPPPPGVNNRPNAPGIIEPGYDNQLLNPADVHMETSAFSDPDPGNTHVCSDYEIWSISPLERVWVTSCIGGLEKLHTHLGDGVFENSHAGRRELLPSTDYKLRVRHKDNSGEAATEWSFWTERPFRTTSLQDPIPDAPGWIVREPGYKVDVVASGFQLPVNIAFIPNPGSSPTSPLFYVTELYGTIKVVLRDGTVRNYASNLLNFNPTGNFPGSGEQGLSGIVVHPTSGDVFAAMLYDPDSVDGEPHYPKIVRFRSTDGGLTASSQTTILQMPGEQQGQSHFISNLSLGPDGKLYVHMGDGFEAHTALDTNSYRGKILRMELDGRPVTNNVFYRASNGTNAQDYIYAWGFRNPFGGDWRARDGFHYEVENGPSVDRFARVVRGRNYRWNGVEHTMTNFATYNWSPAAGPVNIAFIQTNRFKGSGFPSNKWDHAFVSESGPTWATGPQVTGKRISEFVLSPSGVRLSGPTPFVEYNGTGKATVAALAAGPDGLYFSDLYKDLNYTSPIDRGANILRVRWVGMNPPPSVALTEPPTGAQFSAPANIFLAASAFDSNGIVRVEFYSGTTRLGQDTTTPFTLTWSNVSVGTYHLTARALDGSGLWATSAVASVTVAQPNALPTVSITHPTNGTAYVAPARIQVSVTASDADGSVTNLALYEGNTKLATFAATPYTFTWSNVLAGSYTLRAIAIDDKGASATSAVVNLSVSAGTSHTSVFIAARSNWKYLDDGSNPGTNWTLLNYNDSTWLSGSAQFGYGDGDEATHVRSNRLNGTRILTTYFRKLFTVSNAVDFGALYLKVLRDDGVVVYLNGAELFRNNLPTGPIHFDTQALTPILGGEESTNFLAMVVPSSVLRDGTNLVAAEIHQVDTNSSDISFDLELTGLPPLRLFSVTKNQAGAIAFQVQGQTGIVHQIQVSTNFSTWQTVFTNKPTVNPWTYSGPTATHQPFRFYRANYAPQQ